MSARNSVWGGMAGMLSHASWACPMCDLGGRDTAVFLVTVFGLFCAGAASLFFVFVKRGGLKSESLASKVLEVENES